MEELKEIKPDSLASEGEEYIYDYLSNKFTFSWQKETKPLKNDSKSYRKADFYLEKYGLYVEFFGYWNVSEEAKEGYREKKRVYDANNLPCVYIYPENLGILPFLFKRRAIEALRKNGKLKKLKKYRWKLFFDFIFEEWVRPKTFLILLGLGFFISTGIFLFYWGAAALLYVIYLVYKLYKAYYYFFNELGKDRKKVY